MPTLKLLIYIIGIGITIALWFPITRIKIWWIHKCWKREENKDKLNSLQYRLIKEEKDHNTQDRP